MEERGMRMSQISNVFSVYINIVMLCIGLYMTFVQGRNLVDVEHMKREANAVRIMGWIYIVVSIAGFIIMAAF